MVVTFDRLWGISFFSITHRSSRTKPFLTLSANSPAASKPINSKASFSEVLAPIVMHDARLAARCRCGNSESSDAPKATNLQGRHQTKTVAKTGQSVPHPMSKKHSRLLFDCG